MTTLQRLLLCQKSKAKPGLNKKIKKKKIAVAQVVNDDGDLNILDFSENSSEESDNENVTIKNNDKEVGVL